jgi:hypothetical protein
MSTAFAIRATNSPEVMAVLTNGDDEILSLAEGPLPGPGLRR